MADRGQRRQDGPHLLCERLHAVDAHRPYDAAATREGTGRASSLSGPADSPCLTALLTLCPHGAFGRTIAHPIRNNGCRPFTSRSNARGTSGTRPGKRGAISAGGVPDVSGARQTTTPPVRLNFSIVSHGVRSGAVSSSRWGRPASSEIRLASCASPVTARSRWLVRRSKLSPKKRAIAVAGSDVITSEVPVHGNRNVAATTASAGATTAKAQTERRIRWRRS